MFFLHHFLVNVWVRAWREIRERKISFPFPLTCKRAKECKPFHSATRHIPFLSTFVLFDVLYECFSFYGREAYILIQCTIYLSFLYFPSCWCVLCSLSSCYVHGKDSLVISLIMFSWDELNHLTNIDRQLLKRVSNNDITKHA